MVKIKFIKSLDDMSRLNKKLSDDTVSTPYSFLHPSSKKFASDLYWWKQGSRPLFRLSKSDPDWSQNAKRGFEVFNCIASYEEAKGGKKVFFNTIYSCIGCHSRSINLIDISIKSNYNLNDRSYI